MCLAFATGAQNLDSVDVDLNTSQKNEYLGKKWKFLIGFDANRSFFAGRNVKINGLRIGAKYKDVHRFGLGISGIARSVIFKDISVNEEDATDTSWVKFDAGYASLFYEYAFYRTKRWELIVPSYLGAGNVTAAYSDTAGLYQPFGNLPFAAFGTGLGVQFKIFRWFGVKTGVGYRFVYNAEEEIKEAFRGPYYKYGISIFFGELYKMVFKRDELEDW